MTNILDLFNDLTSEFAFESSLLFIKKDERTVVALCAPGEYNGKQTLGAKVENDYKGKPSPQIILKVINVPFDSSGNIKKEEMGTKGLIVPPTVAFQISKSFEESLNNPTEDSKVLGEQKANLISLIKQTVGNKVQTSVMLTSKTFEIPNEVWEQSKEVSLESLVNDYYEMKKAMSNNKEETPEDEQSKEVPF